MATYSITIHARPPGDSGSESDSGSGGRRVAVAPDIHLTLFGSKASSPELDLRELDDPEDAAEATHRFALADLGDIQRVRIRHDDTGVGPGCYVDRVVVRANGTLEEWTFLCQSWLARRMGDGTTERTLDASGVG